MEDIDCEGEADISEIIKHRKTSHGKHMFLVRFVDFPDKCNLWYHEDDLMETMPEGLANYKNSHRLNVKKQKRTVKKQKRDANTSNVSAYTNQSVDRSAEESWMREVKQWEAEEKAEERQRDAELREFIEHVETIKEISKAFILEELQRGPRSPQFLKESVKEIQKRLFPELPFEDLTQPQIRMGRTMTCAKDTDEHLYRRLKKLIDSNLGDERDEMNYYIRKIKYIFPHKLALELALYDLRNKELIVRETIFEKDTDYILDHEYRLATPRLSMAYFMRKSGIPGATARNLTDRLINQGYKLG